MSPSDPKMAFAEYYKVERRRADDCLDDIMKILMGDSEDGPRIEKILDRMSAYYKRDDSPLPSRTKGTLSLTRPDCGGKSS